MSESIIQLLSGTGISPIIIGILIIIIIVKNKSFNKDMLQKGAYFFVHKY